MLKEYVLFPQTKDKHIIRPSQHQEHAHYALVDIL